MIVTREFTVTDRAFVADGWKASFLAGGAAARHADRDHYAIEMDRVLAALLPGGIRIACDQEDPDVLCGFACYSLGFRDAELHYVYVKRDFRKMGVVPMLLDGIPVKRYTFKTEALERRLKPQDRGWVFTPRFTIC